MATFGIVAGAIGGPLLATFLDRRAPVDREPKKAGPEDRSPGGNRRGEKDEKRSDLSPLTGRLTVLFAGSVGRPDLAAGKEPEELARQLYHSLFEKLIPLGAGITVYPGHGSGSPCGGSIGDRDQTTLGYEAEHNAKLQVSDADEFVEKILADLPSEPDYYPRLKQLNAEGTSLTGGSLPRIECLRVEKFARRQQEGAFVLDVREVDAFGSAHLPGAVNIALRSSFPPWAGRIVPSARGFEKVATLLGSMKAWKSAGLPVETSQENAD